MKVHLLPEEIISKIAAGEVIERPASVVKELIENSIDAGTTSLEIHLKEAGKTLIHIKDTGTGIEKDDIETIFLRHSTSKIKSLSDLDTIDSLGFRGEALYSIAAIADVTLKSRTRNQDTGWEIHIRGGKKLDLKPCAMGVGTELEVRELFFNTPARRKFLKSNTTELNQILNLVIPYALLHPACRFLVTHQEKTLLDLQSVHSSKERIAQTLHLDEECLIETQHKNPDKNLSVRMLLGNINIKRSQRDMQFIYINGRPVQSKSISFHMNQIYQLIFPPQVYPFFAVFIEIEPSEIDVNIHPTKREVKIRNEYELATMLHSMAEHALMSAGEAKQVTESQGHNATRKSIVEKAIAGAQGSKLDFDAHSNEAVGVSTPPSYEPYSFPRMPQETQQTLFVPKDDLPTGRQENLQSRLSRSRFIGPLINKFLLFEVDRSLFVVDQHAAQERIAYEYFIKQMDSGKVEAQQLLSPILMKLSPQELLIWEEVKEKLDEIGLSCTLWDNETIALHSYPQLLKNPEPAVRHLLSGDNISHCNHETIARRACRSSVMAGDTMNKDQAEYQRSQLIKCRDPFTCPHGRPTVIELSEKFLDKQFLRT